ncbi:MAG: prolyl oligopeptidase family serine peptidase, partial [Candidatus Bathyarchaeia archaeon]
MSRSLRLEDLWEFTSVSDPQISPNGESIVFVRTDIDYDEDAYHKHLWMWDGEETRQFTHGAGSDTYPRWSPDGSKILFLSKGRQPESDTQLYIIPTAGGEAELVADMEGGINQPRWASDSKRILFISPVKEDETESDVLVIDRPRYKLNGKGMFPGTRAHVFTVELKEEPKQVTEGDFDVEYADWSPSGEEIAIITNMEPGADLSFIKDIYLVPAEGGTLTKVTNAQHTINSLSWSPSREEIAFLGHDLRRSIATNTDIWIIPTEGGKAENLTEGFDRTIGLRIGSDLRTSTPDPGAVWSPDSSALYFVTADIPHSSIYRVDRETGEAERITGGKSVDGFSLSGDGSQITFNAMDWSMPPELWEMQGGEDERVTGFNDSLLSDVKLSTPEHYTWMNGEGREVDAWIIKPNDFTPGGSHPAVLHIHGGPRGVYGDAIFHEFQLLASRGYAVFYTNPRGSGGYSEDYHAIILGNWGGPDYSDLMNFVDQTLERYRWIDQSRLGVTGGSYGGYMTNWIVTHTNRFRAAVSLRSTCNRHSFQGTSDIGYLYAEEANGGNPWDDEDKLLNQSPIRYADKAETPTLLIHSENDLRCPMEQAEQFFEALLRVGVKAQLVRFPDENHDLSRSGKPRHREERLKHILR